MRKPFQYLSRFAFASLLCCLTLIFSSGIFAQNAYSSLKPNLDKKTADGQPQFKSSTQFNGQHATKAAINPRFKAVNMLPVDAANAQAQLLAADPTATIVFAEGAGTPIFISGELLHKAAGASQNREAAVHAAHDFMDNYKSLLQLDDPKNELQLRTQETDDLGFTHLRFDQYYKGVKIWANDLVVHLNEEGVYALNGRYQPSPDLGSVTPMLTQADALEAVQTHLGRTEKIRELGEREKELLHHEHQVIELVLYPNPSGGGVELAWHVTYFNDVIHRWEYFINAKTGKFINRYENTCTIGPATANAVDLNGQTRTINTYEIGGTYYMLDATRPMFNASQSDLPDDPVGGILTFDLNNHSPEQVNNFLSHVTSSNNSWSNPTAVSAHYNAGICYDYFRNTHNRNSLNGQGSTIYSIINITESDGSSLENAFWNGYFMGYGNGGSAFDPLAGGLDVAGHEMAHSVTQNSANLVYQFQSGALNESFSDCFGVMIDRNDWQLGEDIVRLSAFPSGALRDMQNPNNGGSPSNFYWQPAHMNEYRNLSANQDNGGVHVNSGIPNKAFYLFAEAVGKTKAERIYYRALTQYLTQSSQFIDCRMAVIQSAQDLYGNTEATTAGNAFNGVGIIDPSGSGGGGTGGTGYQNDLPPVDGSRHMLIFDLFQGANSIGDINFDAVPASYDELTTTTPFRRPSVTEDGTLAYFVGTDKNVYELVLDVTNPQLNAITSSGDWDNVAVSKDGSRLALVSTDVDHSIYIYDAFSDQMLQYELYNPSTVNGLSGGTPQYADFVEWDPTGEYVLYDAQNVLYDNSGQQTTYWDMGVLKAWNNDSNAFGDGTIFKVFNSLPEGVSIGNATYAKNSDYIIAFDYLNGFTNENAVYGANMETGVVNVIYENNMIGVPSYSPDDDAIAFGTLDGGTEIIASIGVGSDKISPSGSASQIIDVAIWPQWYAKGSRAYSAPQANFTSNVTSGEDPLTVNFFDQSSNSPTQWVWSFSGGNPSTSTLENPIVTYDTPGFYTVSLQTSNPAGNDTETKTSYIKIFPVAAPEEGAFNAIALFPNPSEGIFRLKISLKEAADLEVKVFDPTGREVKVLQAGKTVNFSGELDLSSQTPGLYFVQVTAGRAVHTYKLTLLN